MKKVLFVAVIALLAVFTANAQEFNKGDWAANVGLGLDSPMSFGGSVEHGLVNNTFGLEGLTLGIGAEAGFWSDKVLGIKTSGLSVGVRVPFHYSPVAKLDLYTAPALIYARAKVEDFDAVGDTGFGWTIIGARYYFSENIGVFGELGSDNSLGDFAAGVAFKF